MASTSTEYFSGQGVVSYAERNELGRPVGGFLDLGNCKTLEIKTTVERVEHQETRTGKNATDAVFEKAQKVEINGTFCNFNAENLDLYIYGSSQTLAAATVTAEAITAVLGRGVPLERIYDSNLVLTNSGGATTYTEGTDYKLGNTGLLTFPATGSTITDGQVLEANYEAKQERITTAFTRLNTYRYIRFE